jgi:uncharacterized delta-60 repeat protein
MKTVISISGFTIIFLYQLSIAQVNQEWVAIYNGTGSGYDNAVSVCIDIFGNVYVTGESTGSNTNLDIATIKYNSSGIQQWVQRYNGTGNGVDYGSGVAVDSLGNVYVTGTCFDSGTGFDYVIIKYNSSGVQQWLQKYNGPGNGDDKVHSSALDASGNIYVTGESWGIGTNYDYATVKYNSSGIQEWVARYNGPGDSADAVTSLSVDVAGNVYVTGESCGIGTNFDYATIKYNSSGVQQWVARYDGPANDVDFAKAIAVDELGNIYVTGSSRENIGYNFDYATIKYNSSGVQQWANRFNGPTNLDDEASCIVLDDSDNVYITGSSRGLYFDFVTIKYNSSGVQQWLSRYNGIGAYVDLAYSLALDNSGNVYVTGSSVDTGTNYDYATIKYNSSGTQQWVAIYSGQGNYDDAAYSIVVDGSGSVYLTGTSWRGYGTDYDYATIKYSQPIGIKKISKDIPDKFSLSQNYPNPFNPSTIINYQLPKSGDVKLIIYDAIGRELKTLVNEQQNAGSYRVEFDGSDFSSGIYFYKLSGGDFVETKKMILLK